MTITTRFRVGLFGLLAVVPTLYAQSINPSQFGLRASEYNPAIEKLDEALGSRRKELGELLDTAPFMTARPSDEMYDTPWFIKGFQWNPYVSDDVKSEYWNPEGISTSYDTGYPNDIIPSADGKPGNTGIVVVSWNDIRNRTGRASNPGEGVRVSFVRKGTAELSVSGQAYFNALLVEPFVDSKGNADFRPLRNVISGGIVWRKNWLYVTDRNLGLRVFDLNHIYQVGTGKAIGREDKGYYGGSYSYIIPQALTYETALSKGVKLEINGASLDRNHTTPSILVSESKPDGNNSTVVRFSFDPKTDLLEANALGLVEANWAYRHNVESCEGVVFAEKTYFMVANEGTDLPSRILNWKPGSFAQEYPILPRDAQGIAYAPDGQELWLVGGVPGKRFVMALSATMKNQTIVRPTDDPAQTSPPIPSASLDPLLSGDENKDDGKGLSGGAIAGIVIGTLAGVALIALGIFFLLRRRSHEPAQEPHPSDRFYKSELDSRNAPGSRGTNNTLPHEAAAVVPVEKAAVVPVEKDAGNVPVELESPGWDGTTAYSPGIRSPGIDSVVSPMTYNGGGDWRQEKPRGAWA